MQIFWWITFELCPYLSSNAMNKILEKWQFFVNSTNMDIIKSSRIILVYSTIIFIVSTKYPENIESILNPNSTCSADVSCQQANIVVFHAIWNIARRQVKATIASHKRMMIKCFEQSCCCPSLLWVIHLKTQPNMVYSRIWQVMP